MSIRPSPHPNPLFMNGLIYFLAIVEMFHNVLTIVGLANRSNWRTYWLSMLMAASMFGVGLYAVAFDAEGLFILGFTAYRLAILLESSFLSFRHRRPLSPILSVNLFMIIGAIIAYVTGEMWIFAVSYVLYWGLSLSVGRRLMQRKQPSS